MQLRGARVEVASLTPLRGADERAEEVEKVCEGLGEDLEAGDRVIRRLLDGERIRGGRRRSASR